MPVKINPLLEQFYLFLEKHNALMAWENNFLNRNPNRTRADFFHHIQLDDYRFILAAFTWECTPEGQTYWQDLNCKWYEESGTRLNW